MSIKLTKRELKTRNEIIAELWSEKKGGLTMNELARIFKLDGSTVFYILNPKKPNKKKIEQGEEYKLKTNTGEFNN